MTSEDVVASIVESEAGYAGYVMMTVSGNDRGVKAEKYSEKCISGRDSVRLEIGNGLYVAIGSRSRISLSMFHLCMSS